jgi:prepilin signal peptidase PulO-like enzyme (type II secretory pathway)
MIFEIIIAGILWLCFGSFGHVIISRIHNVFEWKQLTSILKGRSQCPHCHTTLERKQLIPLFSYRYQGGTCTHCGKSISIRYPLSELLMGLIFMLTTRRVYAFSFPLTEITILWPTLIRYLLIHRALMLLVIYDFKTYELHLPIWILLVCGILISQFGGRTGNYALAFGCSLAFAWFFRWLYRWAQKRMQTRYQFSGEGIGAWDIMTAFLIGTLFPYIFTTTGLPIMGIYVIFFALTRLCLSSILGLWYALTQKTLSKNKTLPQTIPFIPWMIIAYRIVLRNTNLILTLWGV